VVTPPGRRSASSATPRLNGEQVSPSGSVGCWIAVVELASGHRAGPAHQPLAALNRWSRPRGWRCDRCSRSGPACHRRTASRSRLAQSGPGGGPPQQVELVHGRQLGAQREIAAEDLGHIRAVDRSPRAPVRPPWVSICAWRCSGRLRGRARALLLVAHAGPTPPPEAPPASTTAERIWENRWIWAVRWTWYLPRARSTPVLEQRQRARLPDDPARWHG
jgi:hypothetical protein